MPNWNETAWEIKVSQSDNLLDVDDDGLIRRPVEGKLYVHLIVPKKKGVQTTVFMVDGKKQPTAKRIEQETKTIRRYVLTVPVWLAEDNLLHAGSYPQNLIRAATMTRAGYVHTWEIAVFGQHEGIFITTQDRGKVRAHRDEAGTVSFPYHLLGSKPWGAMNAFFVDHFTFPNTLPATDLFTMPKDRKAPKIPNGFGRVKWFNFAAGYGCITLSDGTEARVHWTEVLRQTPTTRFRRDFLLPDELVLYGDMVPITNYEGGEQRKTDFKWEVRNVRLAL